MKKGYCVKQGGVVSINQLLFRWMIYLYNSDFTGSKIFGQKLKLRAIVCPIFLSISYGQDLVNERSFFFHLLQMKYIQNSCNLSEYGIRFMYVFDLFKEILN